MHAPQLVGRCVDWAAHLVMRRVIVIVMIFLLQSMDALSHQQVCLQAFHLLIQRRAQHSILLVFRQSNLALRQQVRRRCHLHCHPHISPQVFQQQHPLVRRRPKRQRLCQQQRLLQDTLLAPCTETVNLPWAHPTSFVRHRA